MPDVTLRVLPTCGTNYSDAVGAVNHVVRPGASTPDCGAYLMSKMSEPVSATTSTRCFAVPYRQRWTPFVLQEMLTVIRHQSRVAEDIRLLRVHIEIYFFSFRDQRIGEAVAAAGCAELSRKLTQDCSGRKVYVTWDEAWKPPPKEIDNTYILHPRMCHIESSCASDFPLISTIMNNALEEASRHLMGKIASKSGKTCRTIIIADTASACREQTRRAQTQSIIQEDSKFTYKEEPLLTGEEDTLTFPLVDSVPQLWPLLELANGEDDRAMWNPWDAWLDMHVEDRMRAHRASISEQVKNAGLVVPTVDDNVSFELYNLRRGASKAETVQQKCWHNATPLQQLQIAWLCTRTAPGHAIDFEHLQPLVNYWKMHPGEEWSAKLLGVCPQDALVASSVKQSLVEQINVPVGVHASVSGDKRFDAAVVAKGAQRTAQCFQKREYVFERKVDNELQLLRNLYSSCPMPDLLIPLALRAKSIALEYLKTPVVPLEKKWKFLWYAVIGTEHAHEVSQFLEDLHRALCDRNMSIDQVRLCELGRFWAAKMRSAAYRRTGLQKRNDAVTLAHTSCWLYGLQESACASRCQVDANQKQKDAARTYWIKSLADEAHYFNSVEYNLHHKITGQHLRAGLVKGTRWQRYSTRDCEKSVNGLHLSLEMLSRNLRAIDTAIAMCRKKEVLMPASCCRLFVSGPFSCRFWHVIESVQDFTVVQLGVSPFRSLDIRESLHSHTSSMRCLYQQDQVAFARMLSLHASDVDSKRVHKMRMAIRLALHQVINDSLHFHRTSAPDTSAQYQGWWLAVERLPSDFRVCNLGILLDDEWESLVIEPVALYLCLLDTHEARCRSRFEPVHSQLLLDIWFRRLSLALQDAAKLACYAPGQPHVIFLETLADTFQRGNEEPLLRLCAQQTSLQRICKGRRGEFLYSRDIKVFAEHMVAPACCGPSSLLCFVSWILADMDGVPAILNAHEYGPTSKDLCWFRMLWKNHATPAKARSMHLSRQEHDLANLFSGCYHSSYSTLVYRRQVGFVSALIFKERLSNAKKCMQQQVRGNNEEYGKRMLRSVTELPLRRCLDVVSVTTKRLRTQESYLLELDSCTAQPETTPKETRNEMTSSVQREERPAALSIENMLKGTGILYDHCLEGFQWVLSLCESVHCVRHFCSSYIIPRWSNILGRQNVLGCWNAGVSCAQTLQERTHVASRKLRLTHAITYRTVNCEGKAALLDDIVQYAEHYGESLLGGPHGGVKQAACLLRELLTPHENRSPDEKKNDSLIRRKQTESFAEIMRDLYSDRPRPKGVLDAFGHRIWGTNGTAWTAAGERIKPSTAVLRALRCDPVAEAWNAAFAQRDKVSRDTQHDRERSDAE